MALLFMDGFSGGDIRSKWNPSSDSQITAASTTPRIPGGFYGLCGDGNGCTATKTIPAAATAFVGFGVYVKSQSGIPGCSFLGDNGATQHITVHVNTTTGLIQIHRGGSGGTLLATGTTQLTVNAWYYIEVSASISATVGEVHVRLNGATTDEVSFVGNTKNGGTNTTVDTVNVYAQFTAMMSDVYILDDTGSAPLNTFLGDVAVRTLTPTGDGTYSQLTNSAGNSTSNYSYVDEHPFSGTDYTGSATTGQKDTYALADLPAGVSTVYGVQVCGYMAKSDASLAQARYAVRSGGNDYGGATRALTTTFVGYYDLYTTDPATGAAWTVNGVNNLETGMEVM